jgi:hypothetical protein
MSYSFLPIHFVAIFITTMLLLYFFDVYFPISLFIFSAPVIFFITKLKAEIHKIVPSVQIRTSMYFHLL